MILQELTENLIRCQSLAECDDFLQSNLQDVRPIFYSETFNELQQNLHYFEYEDAFNAFANSSTCAFIRNGEKPPDSVVALLIFFVSLFEKAKLYTSIHAVADLLPVGSLRCRCEAIFSYKHITDASSDYITHFDCILHYLQEAWNSSSDAVRLQCEDLLHEYAFEAVLKPSDVGCDIRRNVVQCFTSEQAQQRYPILQKLQIHSLRDLDLSEISLELSKVSSRIVESLHVEACELVPNALLLGVSDELANDSTTFHQLITSIPDFLSKQLGVMNAIYSPQRQKARFNFDSNSDQNRIYLGTYFPRTVIESQNIYQELLSIPVISDVFSKKKAIRIIDFGSGTGAAVSGLLLALSKWKCQVPVIITSIDYNVDALYKQGEILASMGKELFLELQFEPRKVSFPFDLDGFVSTFTSIVEREGPIYDIVSCWKCLCEFYNVNFAQAQGIIKNTLHLASRMLVSNGLCVVADVTTKDNAFEYFPITINRECNIHDRSLNAITRTVLPIPCSKNSLTCQTSCFTQRRFRVSHQLTANDETKITYRVLAPSAFADLITSSFNSQPTYRVNAARSNDACFNGKIIQKIDEIPCGYTNFFGKGD
ncbi:hypothetical protein HGB07_07645 [Candidatus Roizmanbacteria bacterium]|nr:hypothetical protein [Candidatus Roizmanbacteria bacterium]